MPRHVKLMTASEVARLRDPKRYRVGGASGLILLITPAASKFWMCRVQFNGKRRDVRLGRYPEMSLAYARETTHEVHRAVRAGLAPETYLESAEPVLPTELEDGSHTFNQAAKDFIAFKQSEWKNLRHRKQVRNTLKTYAGPIIGNMDVADITLDDVLKVLKPIWMTKTETASRVRSRIENVLDYATVHKWRSGDNPARWKGLLDKTLPSPGKIRQVRHHPALPFEEMPDPDSGTIQ